MSEKRPNLIYIFADALRYSSLGYNGDNYADTPALDDFSQECTVMNNACSGHPACQAYRASLLTGKYTALTGMVNGGLRINNAHRTMAHVFDENGYNTAFIGKWKLYANRLNAHGDASDSFVPPGPDRLGFNGYFASFDDNREYYTTKAYYQLDDEQKHFIPDGKYEPDVQFDMAIEQIRKLSGQEKPFALFLSVPTPNGVWNPNNVPAEYYDMFDDVEFPILPNEGGRTDVHADMRARFMPGEKAKLNLWKQVYYSMLTDIDDNFDRLIKAVKSSGIYDDTIIVFTSDHGEMFGAQGRKSSNIFYDEAVRVPFLIKWGDKLPQRICETPLNTVDIMPTLLGFMNLPVPESVQGEDISGSIIKGEDKARFCLLMGTGPETSWIDGTEWRGIRDSKYTYAVYKRGGNEFLFDNVNDPYQVNNLASSDKYREVLSSLKIQMYAAMHKIGDNFENNGFYRKNWVEKRSIKEIPQH